MDENSALEVTAVRAVEIRDRARTLWTDADRSWASRAAAEVVGETADAETFVTRRARLALERIGERHPALARSAGSLAWRPWVAALLAIGALVTGIAIDRIGGAQRINLLAPPVFALLAWNLGVYGLLAARYVVLYGEARSPGPLRRIVARWAARAARRAADDLPAGADGGVAGCVSAIASDWARLAAPLYAARSARILHLAAAALAAGVIVGLYVRGLAFEYRATWESTFLDATQVRTLLSIALAPGAALTGLAVPDVAGVGAIRAPASENAARWLHLLAGTVLAIVVLPRLLLAAGTGLVERRRAKHFALPQADPYWQRLLRGFHGGPVRLRVIPHSYTLSPATQAGLEAIAARAFGGSAALVVLAPVAYGDEGAVAVRDTPGSGPRVALFGLAATPEPEVHGAFLQALRKEADPAQPLLVIVDESALRARWGDDAARLRERRRLWTAFVAEQQLAAIVVDLAAPDLAAIDTAIDAALDAAAHAKAAV